MTAKKRQRPVTLFIWLALRSAAESGCGLVVKADRWLRYHQTVRSHANRRGWKLCADTMVTPEGQKVVMVWIERRPDEVQEPDEIDVLLAKELQA